MRTAELVKSRYPDLPIYARARNRAHAHRLLDLGVTHLQRETFLSALDIIDRLLVGLGVSRREADRIVGTFRTLHLARRLGLALAQGGEFAFVLFTVGYGAGALSWEMTELLTIVVTLSMAATPLTLKVEEFFSQRRKLIVMPIAVKKSPSNSPSKGLMSASS